MHARKSLLLTRKSEMLTRKSLLLTRKSEMLARKSLLLTRKSEMLTRKSLLLTRKSEMLARKSLLLTRKSEMLASNLLFLRMLRRPGRRYSGADHDWKGLRECVGSLPAAPAGQSRCRISSARHRPAPWAGRNCLIRA